MAQEFTIKSNAIEDKINQLLPSQGGFQAGVDFSASTMVVPIVDLTETAEGAGVRQDLQTALSLTTAISFDVNQATTTIINTPGYYRIFGTSNLGLNSNFGANDVSITDGTTTKKLFEHQMGSQAEVYAVSVVFDFIVFVEAGESVTVQSGNSRDFMCGSARQIADVSGNLTSP